MRARTLKTGLATGLVLLVTAPLSYAVDVDDFTRKFVAAYASGGIKLEYAGASEQGDSVTLENVTLSVEGETESLGIGDMIFNGVSEDSSGGYLVATVKNDGIAYSSPEFSFSLKDLTVNNLKIPAEAKMETLDDVLYYDSASTGPVVISAEGMDVLQIARSTIGLTKAPDGSRMDFKIRADGLEIDLSDVEDAKAQQAINGMGYQHVGGDLVINGYWSPPDGELTLSEYALTLNDVGRLDLQLSISGYTLEFVKGMQELQERMAAEEDSEKAQQAMGLAMLGMMQQLTFNSLSLRFDDASLTNKVLDMASSQQGMTRDQLVQGLQGMLPFALAQLQNPEFQQHVTEAVSLYLGDPKNIEISARPESPLPFASLAGAAMGAWQSLPEVLNVKVMANQ